MLRRVYIDNFRCLVNFELSLGQQQLILGLNGSGKSTLMQALSSIKALLTGLAAPESLFPDSARTRWQSLSQQTFELDLTLDTSYQFKLELDTWGAPARTRIKKEVVLCEGKAIFEFLEGDVHLFNDRFEHKVSYPFDWFRSALATIQPRPENRRLLTFKRWVENLHCLRLNPYGMLSRSDGEDAEPASDMSNFASWYRHMTQERTAEAAKLQGSLRKLMSGFESLDLRSAGANVRMLAARFSHADGHLRNDFAIGFDELSEGQRILVCLYALLEFLVGEQACLFLDEPENYIALPEIQPWLLELQDRMAESGGQVILMSHHPELINYLAPEHGLVFERVRSGPVRVRPYISQTDQDLPPAEQVARGWAMND